MRAGFRNLRGKRALVMGFGRFGGGRGAAEYLLDQGAQVTVTDLSDVASLEQSMALLKDEHRAAITWRLGSHDSADFAAADLVVANPAVPANNRYLAAAREAGAWVTTDIELFLRSTTMRLALITGTQGKSSTAKILAGLLDAAGVEVHLGGNIGASLLSTLGRDHAANAVAVVELSSYQLEGLPLDKDLAKATTVGVTNLMEDHIDRHGSLESYHAVKARIGELLAPGGRAIASQGDVGYLRENGPKTAAWGTFAVHGPSEHARAREERTTAKDPESTPLDMELDEGSFLAWGTKLASLDDFPLPGVFQQTNALAAIGMALALGVPRGSIPTGLAKLRGLPHRAEELGTVTNCGSDGTLTIRIIDNAVSTTPDSTQSVLEALPGPVTLLVGGRSKGQNLERLARCAKRNTAFALCFGEAAAELQAAFAQAGLAAHAFATMEEAICRGTTDLASPTLLFSPACSSFDAFSNFQQRAIAFRAALPERSK
ncbi:MAG: UDP-N-acetylmuramoyl-L-alanine--D-glutamate ligase [Planctomycetota bacterium]|nr:UDP-N-acetylmuramoyl-L-alanine--D-glutamate ligase [Planctomycetota bacterium]